MKYRKFLFFGLMCLFLVGCDRMQDASKKDIPTSFKCVADVSIGDKVFKCNITHQNQGLLQIDMLSPNSVKDLSFRWMGDRYEVLHKDLKCVKETNIMPQVSFVNELKEILSIISQQDSIELKNTNDGMSEYTGVFEKNNFNFLVDNNGCIQKIWSDDMGWSAQIVEFSASDT